MRLTLTQVGHKSAASLRVIADHSRAATFLISDGVLPSNEGRGYVLRKIIRRAITHGRLLGTDEAVPVQDGLRGARSDAGCISGTERNCGPCFEDCLAGGDAFAHTLDIGLEKLGRGIPAEATAAETEALPGEDAFKLYDTFGMPLDFMQDAARDQGIAFDQAGFDRAMEEQRERARASWKGAAKQTANPAYQQLPKSEFEGYRQTRSDGCEVLAIIQNGQGAQELKPGEEGEVILDHTPFYAESGGQVGDRGWLYSATITTLSSPM